MLIHAVEDIEEGQELTTFYIDVNHDLEERRRLLREKWFFDCNCGRCVDEETAIFRQR